VLAERGVETPPPNPRLIQQLAITDAVTLLNVEHRSGDRSPNGLAIARDLYEANRWIYGDGAFGLRLAAWIARKAPDVLLDTMTLLMFRLREVPDAIKPSDEIAEMAKQTRDACMASRRLELWRNDPRFSEILHPRRMKTAFDDETALKRWRHELNAIIHFKSARLDALRIHVSLTSKKHYSRREWTSMALTKEQRIGEIVAPRTKLKVHPILRKEIHDALSKV
jgi:hypothetical protein